MSSDATRNADATLCRTTGKFDTLMTDLDKCTTTTEKQNIQTFPNKVISIKNDIENIKININDAFLTGDAMFGQYGHVQITNEVLQRNKELEEKKKKLESEIKKNESIIERANRDFSDVKLTLPDSLPQKSATFIEDYTLVFLTASYLFMVILAIYMYVLIAEDKWSAFFKCSIIAFFCTLLFGMLLYYLA
jgi:hypothetical protein